MITSGITSGAFNMADIQDRPRKAPERTSA